MKAQNVSLEGKTILVTGGAGFIGARLSQLLLERIHPVRVVVLDELNDYYDPRLKYWRLEQLRHTADRYAAQGSRFAFVRGSIADEHLVRRTFADYAPAVVVNLAAQAGVRYSIDHPDAYIESNLVGFSGYWRPAATPLTAAVPGWSTWFTPRPPPYTAATPSCPTARRTRPILRSACTRPPRRPMSCWPVPMPGCTGSRPPVCASSRYTVRPSSGHGILQVHRLPAPGGAHPSV